MAKMTTGTSAQGQSPINKGPLPAPKMAALDATHNYLKEHKSPGNIKKGFAHKGKITTLHPEKQGFGYNSSAKKTTD